MITDLINKWRQDTAPRLHGSGHLRLSMFGDRARKLAFERHGYPKVYDGRRQDTFDAGDDTEARTDAAIRAALTWRYGWDHVIHLPRPPLKIYWDIIRAKRYHSWAEHRRAFARRRHLVWIDLNGERFFGEFDRLIEAPPVTIGGHAPVGWIPGAPCLLEYKSMADWSFHTLWKAAANQDLTPIIEDKFMADYLFQIQAYLHTPHLREFRYHGQTGVPQALLIGTNKNTSRERAELLILPDEKLFAQALKEIEAAQQTTHPYEVTRCWEPDKTSGGYHYLDKPCGYCDFSRWCWGPIEMLGLSGRRKTTPIWAVETDRALAEHPNTHPTVEECDHVVDRLLSVDADQAGPDRRRSRTG